MGEILVAVPSEMMGQPSFDSVFPEDASAAQHLFVVKMRGNADPIRFKLRRKDGSAVCVDVQGTPMYKRGRQIHGHCWHIHRGRLIALVRSVCRSDMPRGEARRRHPVHCRARL
jgi:hypothetical protein